MTQQANIIDPIQFCHEVWPDTKLYDKQAEILYSVRDNTETFVTAGNGLGKDYIAALVAIWWMCSRRPARVVTTSVSDSQLSDVLWGEIRAFLKSAKVNLPLRYNHKHIRQIYDDGTDVPKGELVGQCVSQGESLLGRHLPRDIPRTLVIFDEASGIKDMVYDSVKTWAHHVLVIGNPFPCETFFKKKVLEGNIESPSGENLLRNVIHIKAEDSVNIKHSVKEIIAGDRRPEPKLIKREEQPWGMYSQKTYNRSLKKWRANGCPIPTPKLLIPGLIGIAEYVDRRTDWDLAIQCVSLDGKFYDGKEDKLFPREWVQWANDYAIRIAGSKRVAKTIGCDPAEGGDNTAWAVIDEKGLLKLDIERTSDTTRVVSHTIELMKMWHVNPNDVYFDRGGGGKQHADRLRKMGYNVRTVGFGEAASPGRKRGMTPLAGKELQDETRYTYKNRRAEMYGLFRNVIDPTDDTISNGFAIPDTDEFAELKRQMLPIPLNFDGEGRLFIMPKSKPNKTSKETTLKDLLGCSPDELDSVVLAVYGLYKALTRNKVGVMK